MAFFPGVITAVSKIISTLVFLLASSLFASDGPITQLASRLKQQTSANIRVNVDLVLAPVSVMDIYGRSVIGLQRENFAIFDDSQRMPIVSFARQDQPITVGLIFDCSSSMHEKYATAREALRQLFQQLNRSDESFLITVSDKSEVRQGRTSKFEELQNALVFTSPRGRTSLLDGVYAGLQQVRKSPNPLKALVIVSDGG